MPPPPAGDTLISAGTREINVGWSDPCQPPPSKHRPGLGEIIGHFCARSTACRWLKTFEISQPLFWSPPYFICGPDRDYPGTILSVTSRHVQLRSARASLCRATMKRQPSRTNRTKCCRARTDPVHQGRFRGDVVSLRHCRGDGGVSTRSETSGARLSSSSFSAGTVPAAARPAARDWGWRSASAMPKAAAGSSPLPARWERAGVSPCGSPPRMNEWTFSSRRSAAEPSPAGENQPCHQARRRRPRAAMPPNATNSAEVGSGTVVPNTSTSVNPA